MEQINAVATNRKVEYQNKMTKRLALYRPADEEENVFIPLSETADQILQLLDLDEGTPTFIRAPVASGKTTVARFLASNPKYADKFAIVEGTPNKEEQIVRGIIEASGLRATKDSPVYLQDALKELSATGRTLIIDEAHKLLGCPGLKDELFKTPDTWTKLKPPKFLLFSTTTDSLNKKGTLVGTPVEIVKKYTWYPPMPNAEALVNELAAAGVHLAAESVKFFLRLCSGHRGIFMKTMGWVRDVQCVQQEKGMSSPWTVEDAVSMVRLSITESASRGGSGWSTGIRRAWMGSRAVMANGPYTTLSEIPQEFVEVLFGGPKTKLDLGSAVRDLTISGLLTPERTNASEEFARYSWDSEYQLYMIANSLMAGYYNKVFEDSNKFVRQYTNPEPQSVSDLVARALPLMSFASVVQTPFLRVQGDLPASQSGAVPHHAISLDELPFEDDYNDALANALRKQEFQVTTPNNPVSGKADVVVTYGGSKTAVVESIVVTRTDVSYWSAIIRYVVPMAPSLATYHCLLAFCSIHVRRSTRSMPTGSQILRNLITTMQPSRVCSHLERMREKSSVVSKTYRRTPRVSRASKRLG